MASWQLRPGRNPYDLGSNRAYHSASSALRTLPGWHLSAITGIPSGLSFARLPAFGMYTRRTGRGRQESRWECTCTASIILVGEVSATSPSIPAVERPALRCVTCRTLTSVFDQDRNINFCRFLAVARNLQKLM